MMQLQFRGLAASLAFAGLCAAPFSATAQQSLGLQPAAGMGPTPQNFQGSVVAGQATGSVLSLSLDDAIQRGLKQNLGLILSGTQTSAARGERLAELQHLLPDLELNAKEALVQIDLPAQGLRIKGFPTIIGPFGYTDVRANLNWQVLNIASMQRYLAKVHGENAASLSAQDAREFVVLTVGSAYLVALADEAQIESVQAQGATAKVSLDQASANHQAGTAPALDELRAKVDSQRLDQQLIVAQNAFEKDKLALARAIGLPLEQQYTLADKAPYAELDQPDVQKAVADALANRKDLKAAAENAEAAALNRKAATSDRLPTIAVAADYGDIGVNLRHSHGTGDASGTITIPLFNEFAFRGEAQINQAQLDVANAQLNDKRAQVEADVREALLDLTAAQKQVEVARSSVDLSSEALSESQQRYKAGVSDNLAVSQAQQSLAQANDQLVGSLYRHNVAKLALARALGAAQNYNQYLGGK